MSGCDAPAGDDGTDPGALARLEALAGVWEARERRARRNRGLAGAGDGGGPGHDRRQLFELARRMVAGGTWLVGDLYGGPVEDACRRLGLNPEDVFADLAVMLERVGTGPAADALSEAMAEADLIADRFRNPARTEGYARAAALAFCLSRLRKPCQWFPLPRDRIARWLGVCDKTAGTIIRTLDRDGVIRLKRDQDGNVLWNPKTGEAREARYRGPRVKAGR